MADEKYGILVQGLPRSEEDAFWEWVKGFGAEKPSEPYYSPGARVVIDENGEGVLTIDESLPDGVWFVTKGGKTMRLEGVQGPVMVESKVEDPVDIERSPVALTFEGREP